MNKIARKMTAAVMLAVVLMFPAAGAGAAPAQGRFAMALAQILGFEVTSVGAAVLKLEESGIAPKEGWRLDGTMTVEEAGELQAAVDKAVSKGLVPVDLGRDAVLETARATGFEYGNETGVLEEEEPAIQLPRLPPMGGSARDGTFRGIYRDGSYPGR
jgi:hypothetical protein